MLEVLIVLVLALTLDFIVGEVNRFHPLVGFGNVAGVIEQKLNLSNISAGAQKSTGVLAWLLLVLPLPMLYWLAQETLQLWLLDAVVLYFAIGNNSLKTHALQVLEPLQRNDLEQARHFCSYLVSRDTSELNEHQISRAVTESVLENGHDAVVASLFWYCAGGAPLVIAHRLANTLDAMWGYKTQRFINFGWCSARADDLLGWPSAKVTALLFAVQSKQPVKCLTNAYIQAKQYKSFNGGWAMASGATALNICLGGQAIYFGRKVESVTLGQGDEVQAKHIKQSVELVSRAALLFVVSISVLLFILEVFC